MWSGYRQSSRGPAPLRGDLRNRLSAPELRASLRSDPEPNLDDDASP